MATDFEISYDLARLDFELTSQLLKASYWGAGRTDAINRRAFENSVCVIALIDGKQMGFARASGDRTTFARMSDVIVWPECRGRGLGKALVRALLDHPELKSVASWSLATDDAHGLYQQFGFVPANGAVEMRLIRSIS